MANYHCVALGINRYQFLQALSYAQADAQGVFQFVMEEGRIASAQGQLWTDGEGEMPTVANLRRWLEESSSPPPNFASGILWFFFSGYGAHYQGEDYLLPLDANPQDIPGTAIPVRQVFQWLQGQGASRVLAIFDMNRALGAINGLTVGRQTLQLGEEMGIATLLSCQPQEFSHEASALGHGMFTGALLEALRYYRQELTPEHLEQYLRDRLKQLSEHHWRPVQTPVLHLPNSQAHRERILPLPASAQVDWQGGGTPAMAVLTAAPPAVGESTNGHGAVSTNGRGLSSNITVAAIAEGTTSPDASLSPEPPLEPAAPPAIAPRPTHPSGGGTGSPEVSATVGRWVSLGLLGGSMLVAAALLTRYATPTDHSGSNSPPSSTVKTPPAPDAPPDGSHLVKFTPPSPGAPVLPGPTPTPPAADRPVVFDHAYAHLGNTSASGLNEAIRQVRQIPPGDPHHELAQQKMAQWSQMILDIAEGRANQENYWGAIAAAQLVPKEFPALYQQAQNQIASWQSLRGVAKANQALLTSTGKLLNPTQASSYNRAIDAVRVIQPGEPGYTQAQKLMQTWSRQIYLIANARAARKQFGQAVATAKLIPEDSTVYASAQQAIARWQKGKK